MSIGIILFICLMVLLLGGLPIAACIGGATVITMIVSGLPLMNFASKVYASVNSFTLMAIPFFMLAGSLMATGGMSRRLVRLASSLVGWVTGGLTHVMILASAFFAALSGSAPATCAAIGGMMIPEMKKKGFPAEFSAAVQAVAGTIGPIIPPSIPMVVYAISASTSVGAMFAGGILPGIIYAICLMVVSALICKKKGFGAESKTKFDSHEVWDAFKDAIWALLVPVIILGGIYSGIFTPTEAGAVAVAYGLFAGIVIYREISWKDIIKLLLDTAANTSMVMVIVGCAGAFTWVLNIKGIASAVGAWFASVSSGPAVFMILTIILLLFMGCFMECCASVLMVVPILLPVATSLGIDPVYFGVIVCMTLSLGIATPPVGEDLYIAASIAGVKFEQEVKYVLPLVGAAILAIVICTALPGLVMFIPNLIYG